MLARRNLGQAWPNPAVGALVVRDGQIVAQGWTGRGGRPHAETVALDAAGERARGATLYVSLEPCAHHGKTPPCADAIIKAGIARCVVACRDVNPQVAGLGIARLREAGIEVVEDVCREEAVKSHEGFFSLVEKKRPFVALKIAVSADGKITTGDTKNPWITSGQARAYGQLVRSRYDAIATGIGTVLADDPLLTCRLPGLEDRSPVRVVIDRRHRLPPSAKIMRDQDKTPTWVLDKPDIAGVLAHLAGQGITRLLVEAGQALSAAFLDEGVTDRIYWFRGPGVIGEKGMSFACDLSRWQVMESRRIACDTLDVLEPCSPAS